MPRRELTEQVVEFPEKLFYLGQTVQCRIINCKPEEEKLVLSLRVSCLQTNVLHVVSLRVSCLHTNVLHVVSVKFY